MAETRKNAMRNAQEPGQLHASGMQAMMEFLMRNLEENTPPEIRRDAVSTLAGMVRDGTFEVPQDAVRLLALLEECKKDAACTADAQVVINRVWGSMRLEVPMKRSRE